MNITLSDSLSIPAMEYASQGNAILGIRDSGKSYTATLIAEQLLEAKIPFVAFDPIGVWRYLKVGKNGNGYPVVIAGDNGDLPLSADSAANIVRAAMKENISLVIDLYSMKLSKADWKRIVQQSVELLLYENKTCGLRHIFIEEAAEFCPQRVGPDQGRVYAEIEKLARMGGNASLGFTLINQRAEEVNKAVLELCDCLILHRQKGRHSLTALGKWLDIADSGNSSQIIKTLPTLEQGECWVWLQGSQSPQRIKVNEKKTVHPDRRNPLKITKAVTVDVTEFVTKLKRTLEVVSKSSPVKQAGQIDTVVKGIIDPHLVEEQKSTIAKLETALQSVREELRQAQAARRQLEGAVDRVKQVLRPQYDMLRSLFDNVEQLQQTSDPGKWEIWLPKFTGKNREMLKILIERRRVTKAQLGLLVGMSTTSGTFTEYIGRLSRVGLVTKDGDDYVLQEID